MVVHTSDYFIGGLASVGATVFTNPIEVVKTRIQLQGELAAKGTYVEPYKGIFRSLVTIARNDGITGLQKGLISSFYFQFVLNAVRLGIYSNAVDQGWTKNNNGDEKLWRHFLFGSLGGLAGGSLSSPFLMLKTHIQSQAAKSIAVGYQHQHTGTHKAFLDIYREFGIKGLYRGVSSTVPRSILGSGGQLATFGITKDYIMNKTEIRHPFLVSLLSGVIAGSVMAVTITPPDVVATRIYNQGVDKSGKGLYYNGVIDCCKKILKAEGPLGFYKGFWPTYLRIGPHATLVLLFFDQLKIYRDLLWK